MKQITALFVSVLLSYAITSAQSYVELLKLSHTSSSNNAFKDSSGSFSRIQESNADVTLPVKFGAGHALLTGLTYERIDARLFANSPTTVVSSYCIKVGANIRLNDVYSATVVLLPKWASDFRESSASNFQLGAMAFVKRKISDRMNYRYGLYYNAERLGPFFVPIFGLYYISANSKFETTFMLPNLADANYALSKKVKLGVHFSGQVRTYHLHSVSPLQPSRYMQKISNELYGYVKWQITSNISLSGRLGRTFGRKFRVFTEGEKVSFGMPLVYVNDHRTQLNTNFKDGFLYQLSVSFRVPVK